MATVLVTGGAGFVGANLADHLVRSGHRVLVVDDLRRPGSERNAAWLAAAHGDQLEVLEAALENQRALETALAGCHALVHLAAQVAVTGSLREPLEDFEVNARGTLLLLESMRHLAPAVPFLYASTNKVYGPLSGVQGPVDEDRPLDPRTPYGCSKATADLYVREYHRSFGLRTVVFRQSCVYGPLQYGSEDQGWVAHFVHETLAGRPLTIFGNGEQVRDLLEVSDLVRLYALAVSNIDRCAGRVFNVGGGPQNARSLLQVIEDLRRLMGQEVHYRLAEPRPADQASFIADGGLARRLLGWEPAVGVEEGLTRLIDWAQNVSPGSGLSRPRSSIPG
jgi:CDP-paratose 2-epimerase